MTTDLSHKPKPGNMYHVHTLMRHGSELGPLLTDHDESGEPTTTCWWPSLWQLSFIVLKSDLYICTILLTAQRIRDPSDVRIHKCMLFTRNFARLINIGFFEKIA